MAEADSAKLIVNIHGKNYTFAFSPDQNADQIHRVAHMVDQHMRQVSQEHHPQSPLQAAILAGMTLVDELFKLRSDYQAAESEIAQRTSRLAASLGRVFQSSEADSSR